MEGVEFLATAAPYLCDRWAIWTENSFNDNPQAEQTRAKAKKRLINCNTRTLQDFYLQQCTHVQGRLKEGPECYALSKNHASFACCS